MQKTNFYNGKISVKRKILIPITSRGNYAKFKSVILELIKYEVFEVHVMLGGMSNLEKYGNFSEAIRKLGVVNIHEVHFVIEGDGHAAMTKTAGMAGILVGDLIHRIDPEFVFIMADRFECLPMAMAAAYQNKIVVHFEGGEISGSIDESIRHAITKMSHIHFVCSEEARQRVIKLGEDEANVHNVGSTSFDILAELNLEDLNIVREHQNLFGFGRALELHRMEYAVILQHPVTTEYSEQSRTTQELLRVVTELDIETVWLQPNMDAGSHFIEKILRRDSDTFSKIHVFKSLAIELYGPLINNAKVMIGNSSSGVRESGFLGIPSVNVGNRQNQRAHGYNVIDASPLAEEILDAVQSVTKTSRYERSTIYGDGQAAKKIAELLSNKAVNIQKINTY